MTHNPFAPVTKPLATSRVERKPSEETVSLVDDDDTPDEVADILAELDAARAEEPDDRADG